MAIEVTSRASGSMRVAQAAPPMPVIPTPTTPLAVYLRNFRREMG
jgi:hypothetical protein